MASQNQSIDNVEECNEVCTFESTTLCKSEKTSNLDDNKLTNEGKRQKSDTCMQYCNTCHSQMSETDTEQHKGHGIISLSTAANRLKQTLEESITKIKRKNEKLHKSCLENIEQNNDENVKLKIESLHHVLNDEYRRVERVFQDSFGSAKRDRESQYEKYLKDLQNTRSSLDENIRTLDEISNEIEKCSDADLLRKEATFNKKMENCETVQHLPLFDIEEATSIIQALYSEKDKENLKQTAKEHEQLRKEREYFENGFETVMSLLKSLLDYRGNNKKGIGFFSLPALPGGMKPYLKKMAMKDRRQKANDDLNRFRNIAVKLIDFERVKEQVEVDSNEEPKTKDSTHESTTTESETQLKETKETIQRIKDQNARMKTMIKTIGEWINICQKSVKQSEVDKIELTLPSEHVMNDQGKKTLETYKKKLKDIWQRLSETCTKCGQIEKEKNYFEQLLHGSFTWLHSVPDSDGESEIDLTLPDVPKLDDEERVQDLHKDRVNKQNMLKNIKTLLDEKQKIFKEGEKLKQIDLEKNYFEKACKRILTTLTSTLESIQNIKIRLPEVPELEDKTKSQEMKEERKKAKDVLKELLTNLSETCKKLGQIEKEKNYIEQLLHGSFTWLYSVPKSEGESEIEMTLPDVPKLDDNKRVEDLQKDRVNKQNVLKNIKTLLDEHQHMVKECVKLRKIQLEKNFYESSFKETFQTLTSILQSSHRVRKKLPEVPELEGETKHQEMEEERKDAMKVLKDVKRKIFEEGKKLKQMDLEKTYFEKACKQILATLTSTLESRHNINISLPKVPELEDETKSQEMKEERKIAKDVLKELLTKDNKEDFIRLKNKLQEAEDKADRAVFEWEKALTRLSEIAGSRLRENNPMIADLSDDYRPTKLAEKHGELYDNEWTDAFQIITTKLKKSDIIAIEMLLKLLKDIYHTCSEMAQKQLHVLLCPMQFEESEDQIKVPGLLKKVKDFQKQAASDMIIVVEEVMKTKSRKTKERKFGKELDLCESYIHSCIKLCWMMSVQDPPVVLVFEEKNGEKFNRSLFRPYTRSGKYTDYMVWPAMLLHEEGPLLHKGVVQPK